MCTSTCANRRVKHPAIRQVLTLQQCSAVPLLNLPMDVVLILVSKHE